MTPETLKLLLFVIGRSVVTILAERGKFDQAAVLTDALAGARAGKNIDAALGKLADAWATVGEPPLSEITAARLEIQAQMD